MIQQTYAHFNRHWFELLWAMTEKEIKARYKHAVFGFLWVILNPLFQMVVIGIIFSFFVKVPVENYFLFLFAGLLPWQFFSLSLAKATQAIVYERNLLQKAQFPREVIPLSIIFSNFVHFGIALLLLVLFLAVCGLLRFPQSLLFIPASLLLLSFTIGASLLTASLQVRYRDIKFFVQSLLIVWFYATPVVYSMDLLPSKIRWFFSLNPLTAPFELFHSATLGLPLPRAEIIGANVGILILVMLLGLWAFRRLHNYFVDWL
jgi:ABC-2 type transport system permease protein